MMMKKAIPGSIMALIMMTGFAAEDGTVGSAPAAFTEIQIYRIKPEVSLEVFLEKSKGVEAFLAAQPGFLSRSTSVSSDNTILEVARWTSKEAFKQMEPRAMEDPRTLAFFEAIDLSSLQTYFGEEKRTFSKP